MIEITCNQLSGQARANIRRFLSDRKITTALKFHESEDSFGVKIKAAPEILSAVDALELHSTVSRLQYPPLKKATT